MAVIDTPKELHELDGVPIGRIYELVDELHAANRNMLEANKQLVNTIDSLINERDDLKERVVEYENQLKIAKPIKGQRIELEPGERLIIDAGFY